jgi:hypothetical protein
VPADTPTKPPRQRLPLNAAIPRPPKLPAEYATEAGEARPGAGGAEETPAKSRRAGLELRVGNFGEFVKGVGILVAIILGAANQLQKAPEPKVDAVRENVSAQQTDINGPGGLRERVERLERDVTPLVGHVCHEQQFLSQVFARLDPPILIRPENCPRAPAPIQVTVEPAMPGKRGRGATVVHSPYPMPRAE